MHKIVYVVSDIGRLDVSLRNSFTALKRGSVSINQIRQAYNKSIPQNYSYIRLIPMMQAI